MARARNIKPGFFDDEQLAETGPYGMLVFAGLWTLADREGRLEDRPRRIQARILPYFDEDVEPLLRALDERGFIIRYEVAGQRYIQVTNFSRHQTPHVKEAASTIPTPGLHQTSTVQTDEIPHETVAPDKHGANTVLAPPDSLNRIPDSLIADTGFSESSTDAPAALDPPKFSPKFLAFWNEWLRGVTNGHGGRAPSWVVWQRMKLDRAGPELMAGLARWKASDYWQQENGRFVMAAERWLKDRKWDDDPPPVPARASPNGRGSNDPNAMFDLAKRYAEQGQ